MENEFRKWEYFLTVAKTLNFTEAAGELFISTQALTQQISKFEEALGVKLFIRNTRKVQLTPFGEYCLDILNPVKDAYDSAMLKIENRKNAMSADKRLRIEYFNALPKESLMNLCIEKIQSYFKDYELEFFAVDLENFWKVFDEGKADIGITMVSDSFMLDTYLTSVIEVVPGKIIVSQKHRWAGGKKVTPEDMLQEKMVQLDQADISKEDEKSVYKRIQCNNVKRVTNFDSMLMYLMKEHCFAVFPNIYSEKKNLHFKALPLPKEYACDFKVIYVSKKGTEHKKIVRFFNYLNDVS